VSNAGRRCRLSYVLEITRNIPEQRSSYSATEPARTQQVFRLEVADLPVMQTIRALLGVVDPPPKPATPPPPELLKATLRAARKARK
jgi:hypothetical protein